MVHLHTQKNASFVGAGVVSWDRLFPADGWTGSRGRSRALASQSSDEDWTGQLQSRWWSVQLETGALCVQSPTGTWFRSGASVFAISLEMVSSIRIFCYFRGNGRYRTDVVRFSLSSSRLTRLSYQNPIAGFSATSL